MWNQPSSSGSGGGFTLAQELLGLPTISQGFTAKVRCPASGEWQERGDAYERIRTSLTA
jgi:hypothetical protein